MAARDNRNKISIYQVKVRLLGVTPPVWRRLLVSDETMLGILHLIIQVAMGWENYHAHVFTVGKTEYSSPKFGMEDVKNENRTRLKDLVTGPRMKMYYEYDLGDGWLHSVIFEKHMPPEQGIDYPVCIAGKRSCPPEDCGGPWGYKHFLEAIGNPDDPEHEEMLEWAGGEFDPEAFDIVKVNQFLKRIRMKGKL